MWRKLRQSLKQDSVGGLLLLCATITALILANSPAASWYESVRNFTFGPEALHLNLSVGAWAADGLLAIFFFVVGLELKEEFVVGKLRNPRTAIVPITAALGGVAVPALFYLVVNLAQGSEALHGWAIPAATDIAFAVAVIAVIGKFLPAALRTFLLTLAVVDDLLAITIIALFYSESLAWQPLALALIPLAGFAVAVQRGIRSWWILLPLGITVWALVHASGIHATVAGVVLGFAVPVIATKRARVRVGTSADDRPIYEGLAPYFADRWSVPSSVIAVPIFAFFAAGVQTGGLAGLQEALTTPITLGIITGLVAGKSVGISVSTFLITRLPGVALDRSIKWVDLIGMSFVAGIGFTVSLLVGELAFEAESREATYVKVGVLCGSLLAAVLGALILALRNRSYKNQSQLQR